MIKIWQGRRAEILADPPPSEEYSWLFWVIPKGATRLDGASYFRLKEEMPRGQSPAKPPLLTWREWREVKKWSFRNIAELLYYKAILSASERGINVRSQSTAKDRANRVGTLPANKSAGG